MAFASNDCKRFTAESHPEEFAAFLNEIPQAKTRTRDLNFEGGWIGYIAYEAYRFNDLVPFKPSYTKDYPLAVFRYYDSFIHINHYDGKKYFISLSKDAKTIWDDLCQQIRKKRILPIQPGFTVTDLRSLTSRREYNACFGKVKDSILNGDYFELNYTIEYSGRFSGDPVLLYKSLRKRVPAPMMAYIGFSEIKVLSASPERFFKITDRLISTFPIKGTMKRGATLKEDEQNKLRLIRSSKDKAELLMVTDMLRNDLGRFCQTGSVKVEALAGIHTFSHYHHLIAKISGELRQDSRLSDIFFGLFPGGSITGAPKIRVMEHIDRLENRARGVYTGAIGYISNNGVIDFNIPIRTITIKDGHLSFAVGGGIVADSECEAEFEECLVKAAGILEAIQA